MRRLAVFVSLIAPLTAACVVGDPPACIADDDCPEDGQVCRDHRCLALDAIDGGPISSDADSDAARGPTDAGPGVADAFACPPAQRPFTACGLVDGDCLYRLEVDAVVRDINGSCALRCTDLGLRCTDAWRADVIDHCQPRQVFGCDATFLSAAAPVLCACE